MRFWLLERDITFSPMLSRSRLLLFSVALAVCFGAEPTVLLRVDSSMVLVPVHVSDMLGSPVTNLLRSDFRLSEDGVQQKITYFAKEDAPVSVGLLFDSSGSMKNKTRKSLEAATAFFKTANPEDEFFLVEFGDRAKLSVPFTLDSTELFNRIVKMRPQGQTSLLDAIHIALNHMKKARNTRKALVILSDGGDNCSRQTVREIKRMVAESDAIIYAMGIFDREYLIGHPEEEKNGPKLLEDLAQHTGGNLYSIDRLEDLPSITMRISEQLRSQYLLGFAPANNIRNGKYRHLKLDIDNTNAPILRTEYRRGYYSKDN